MTCLFPSTRFNFVAMSESQTVFVRKRKIETAPKKAERIKGEKYILNNEVRIWTGEIWRCQHDRFKYNCRLCQGSGICSHGTRKGRCRVCKGSGFCSHGNRKPVCRQCQGSSICSHNKEKYQCRQCHGSSYCQHDTLKHRCRICSPDSKVFCIHCKYTIASNPLYGGNCFRCYCQINPDKPIPTRFMLKENHIHDYLREQFPGVNLVHGKTTQCNEFKRRPDWIIDCFRYVVVIECDEHGHKSYSCENKRMMQILSDFDNRPVVFIRFNPDKYNGDSCFTFDENNKLVVNDTWHIRKIDLKHTIQRHLDTAPEKECTIDYLFYNSHAETDSN